MGKSKSWIQQLIYLSTAPPDIPKVESPKESVPDSTAQTEHDTSPSSRLDPKPPVTDNEKLAVDATKQGSPVEGDVVQNNNSGVTKETNALPGESASTPRLEAEVAKPGDVPPSLDTKVSDDQTVREKSTPLDIKGADEANKSGPTEHHVPAAAPVPPEVVDTVDEVCLYCTDVQQTINLTLCTRPWTSFPYRRPLWKPRGSLRSKSAAVTARLTSVGARLSSVRLETPWNGCYPTSCRIPRRGQVLFQLKMICLDLSSDAKLPIFVSFFTTFLPVCSPFSTLPIVRMLSIPGPFLYR